VAKAQEFVFTSNGQAVGDSAKTLRELAATAKRVPPSVVANHSRKHDFSRWISDLFCDHELANEVRRLENSLNIDKNVARFVSSLAESVERRYEEP
jgi:hypothetical protein